MISENLYKTIDDMDDLQFRLSCGIGAVGAIHELIEGAGGLSPKSYADALFGVYDYLQSLSVELRGIIDHPGSSERLTIKSQAGK